MKSTTENIPVIGGDFTLDQTAESKIFDLHQSDVDLDTVAFLCNFKTVQVIDQDNNERTCLMLIFYSQEGYWFNAYVKHEPYFFIKCKEGFENDIISYVEKRFEGDFSGIKIVEKQDLDQLNHLSGIKRKYVQINFLTINKMVFMRNQLEGKIREYSKKYRPKNRVKENVSFEDIFEVIEELREHRISYSARVCIDQDLRVSFWYDCSIRKNFISNIQKIEEIKEIPDFTVLAFDIETTKAPLKFPDPNIDVVMLISYVIDGETFLIVNREICSQDIKPFTYSPIPQYESTVTIFNEKNEKDCLVKFIQHIKHTKPFILTTFNGDYFDIPFIKIRAESHKISLEEELGLVEAKQGLYQGKYLFVHLDCFYWVKRDAFLPQGSQGLKTVTKKKLGYNPIEVDPEKMVQMAKENPQKLCEYSVSDAVATYYLYKKQIHDYIFALCTIVPMQPDDVLRRGSGTLCEHLLMAQAYSDNIVFPNSQRQQNAKYYDGYLIDSETYVGGYVECLNNGIYRNDIKTDFKLDPKAFQELIGNVDKILKFFIEVEKAQKIDEISNLEEVKTSIIEQLQNILSKTDEQSNLMEYPLIYHVDVSSMYPNIILTNRLQPTAIVDNRICSNCVYNEAKNNCKRIMGWDYKVSYYPINKAEYSQLKATHTNLQLKQAIKTYSQKNYKVQTHKLVKYKEDTVCMRENSFYVDTIRDFRDRRYRYKRKAGFHGRKYKEENDPQDKALKIYYDSMQLAHKIILNSFYGYVMKRGARWYSMEMAAMVTYTGAKIIQQSKILMDKLGKPLELDTDGIWTLLPKGFPENYNLKTKSGKKLNFSLPCSLMNWLIYDQFKNNQYQFKEKGEYQQRQEMSIFFEIDGPYKAMVIPASREENKKLKKRYCVFDFDGKITEIKGFEIKRRGELKIVKEFQKDIFKEFLKGSDLEGLYGSCAKTTRKWLKILETRGEGLDDERILELLSQLKVLSRSIEEYSNKANVAITAAKRLFEFLGDEIQDTTGLNCTFIISKKPETEKINQRAIPILIFQLNKQKRDEYLRRWLKIQDASKETLKSILDWDYYQERFFHHIQKIVTIPAILQGLDNPLPEVPQPEWLKRKLIAKNDLQKQVSIHQFFQSVPQTIKDIEDFVEVKQVKEIQQKQSHSVKKLGSEMTNLRLRLLKEQWKEQRRKMKHQSIEKIQMSNQNMQLYTQKIERRIKQIPWRIIKVLTTINGNLKYWVLIDDKIMLCKKIGADQIIYINSFVPDHSGQSQESKKKLPRNKTNHFLYEIHIDRENYLETMNNLQFYLTNPDIEGVYETQVVNSFRAIVRNGSCCRVLRECQKNQYYDINSFKLDDSISLNKIIGNSLTNSTTQVIYIYGTNISGNDLVMIFSEKKLMVFKCQKIKETKQNQLKYKNFLKEKINHHFGDSHEDLNSLTVNIEYQLIMDKIEEIVVNYVVKLVGNNNVPKLLISQVKNENLEKFLIKLDNVIPSLQLSYCEPPNLHYSSLDWHLIWAEYGLLSFMRLRDQIYQFEELANFCQIPLCNLSPNYNQAILQAIDILFARELDKNYAVWWYSNFPQPDLGIKKISENFQESIFQKKQTICEFQKSSICENYVVEIEIAMFHFNSLIVSEILNPKKNLINSGQKKKRKIYQDATYSNKMGFNIIKDLFMSWYKQVRIQKNKTANIILQNLVRWMCCEDSKFYDPFFKSSLDRVIKKIFEEFLDTIEELGAEIIYASPYKLLINTKRDTYYSANTFIQFLLESLLENQKFSYLIMNISRVFKMILFKDIHNYSGIDVDLETLTNREKVDESEITNDIISIASFWKIKELFPQAAQKYFESLMNTLISKYFEIVTESYENFKYKPDQKIDGIEKLMEEYLFNDFSTQFLELVDYIKEQTRLYEIQQEGDLNNVDNQESHEDYENDSFLVGDGEKYDGGDIVQDANVDNSVDRWKEPNYPGKKYKSEDFVIDFVKNIFSILIREKHHLKNTFKRLYNDILEHLHIESYSEQSQFQTIFLKFPLLNLTCNSCYMVRNIDLFQDYDSSDQNFKCLCLTPYNQHHIEVKIIQLLQDCLYEKINQREYCQDCKQLNKGYLIEKCDCGGKYKVRQDSLMKEFDLERGRQFANLKMLAIQTNMKNLKDFVMSLEQLSR